MNNQQVNEKTSGNTVLLIGLILVVCAVVLMVYWPVLSAQAVSLDDNKYLTENLLVQNPGWNSTRRFLTEVLRPSKRGYYQPMTMISLMVDYALGGRSDNLRQFHRTSLALHLINTALVIVLLYLLFSQAPIAAALGLLFGLHPINVEPIAWLAERTTMLGSFFALLCLVFYVRYGAKRNWKLYVACLMMYVLALISKPTTIPLPLLMLLLDYWPLRRWQRQDNNGVYGLIIRAIKEKLPFFALAGIFAFITLISRWMAGDSSLRMPTEYGPLKVPLLICHNIIFYLYKIIWPTKLSVFYPFPEPLGLSDPMILAGVIGTAVLIVLLLLSRRWTPAVLICGLIYVVALAPTIQVINFSISIAADKYVYLPAIGLLMLLVLFFVWLARLPGGRLSIAVIVLLLASGESVATRKHLAYWRDSVTLYEYMLTVTPNSTVVHNQLGDALKSEGKFPEAMAHYNQALRCNPNYFKAHNNLGALLTIVGRLNEAIDCYHRALQLNQDYSETHYNLGVALSRQGKLDQAVEHYRKALQLRPDFPKVHNNLANVLSNQGKLDEAIKHYRQALRLQPNYAEAYNNLGSLLVSHGELYEGINCFRQTLQIKPDFALAHCNLAIALEKTGQLDEAIKEFHQAARLEPAYPKPLAYIAQILTTHPEPQKRDLDQAILFARQACELTKYQDLPILNTLATAYAQAKQYDQAGAITQKMIDLALAAQAQELADQLRKKLESYNKEIP